MFNLNQHIAIIYLIAVFSFKLESQVTQYLLRLSLTTGSIYQNYRKIQLSNVEM